MNEKITTEELLIGKALAAELEAAKSKAEMKAAQLDLHINRLSRKYNLEDGDGMTEDGTIVRVKRVETPVLESVK